MGPDIIMKPANFKILLGGVSLLKLKKECCEVTPIIIPQKSSLKSYNFYLVKHGQSLSLIDAGINNEECWNGLISVLDHNGYSLSDLTEVILTHHHSDHIGLVNRIISESSIPVYAHRLSIPHLKRDPGFLGMRIEFFNRLYQEMGCAEYGTRQIDYLKKALIINQHQALQAEITPINHDRLLHFSIIETPGHTLDQIGLFDESMNWLFAGDLLIEHLSSNALVEPDQDGNRIKTLVLHLDSLRKCLTLNPDLVFSGHGVLIENPSTLIKKRIDRIEAKSKRIFEFIQAGTCTGNALALSLYKHVYEEQFSLVMSEIIGHLDYLEHQGRVKKEMIQGVWHYKVI
jgi:glyoxylase-like metal-dependent hydrolase (beta-lactamase superfamily II)